MEHLNHRKTDQPIIKLMYWIMGVMLALLMAGSGYVLNSITTDIKRIEAEAREQAEKYIPKLLLLEEETKTLKEGYKEINTKLDLLIVQVSKMAVKTAKSP